MNWGELSPRQMWAFFVLGKERERERDKALMGLVRCAFHGDVKEYRTMLAIIDGRAA